jgi:outer membrane protein OmpA-like peptidoglycan-associated protein
MRDLWMRLLWGGMILAMAVLGATAAFAEDNPRVNMDYFRPSVHPADILNVQTANQPKGWEFGGGLWFTLNNKPLRVVDSVTGKKVFGLVTNQFVADAFGHVGLFDFLDVGVDIPLFLMSSGDDPDPAYGLKKANGFALGDIRLGIKGTFLGGNGKGFGLALGEDVTFPTATKRNFSGDASLSSTTMLIADYSQDGWNGAINLGYRLRKNADVAGYTVGDELLFGAGLSAPIICGFLEGIGTAEVRTSASKPFGSKYANAVDLMGGARLHFGPVNLLAAGGGGLLQGYGSAAIRGTLMVSYDPPVEKGCVKDRDGDTVPDPQDKCPDTPGLPSLQGCPDRDGDGIIDSEDACPDVKGLAEFRGCPDTDKDGIPDPKDACPTVPGIVKFQGCPDSDNDGIEDSKDKCPKEAGPASTQGCPDRDKDGIPDNADKCPDIYGKPEFEGCPPPTPASVKLTAEKIEILQVVNFDTNKATIKKDSFQLLQDVSKVLNDNPNIRKIRVEGHTDNVGKPDKNLKLSKDRAASVMKFLVEQGKVDAARLVSEGYGDTKPVADNGTKEGKAKNRRVEFLILEK